MGNGNLCLVVFFSSSLSSFTLALVDYSTCARLTHCHVNWCLSILLALFPFIGTKHVCLLRCCSCRRRRRNKSTEQCTMSNQWLQTLFNGFTFWFCFAMPVLSITYSMVKSDTSAFSNKLKKTKLSAHSFFCIFSFCFYWKLWLLFA